MKKYNIPTAGYENFEDSEKALEYLSYTGEIPCCSQGGRTCSWKGRSDLQ